MTYTCGGCDVVLKSWAACERHMKAEDHHLFWCDVGRSQ